MTERCEACHAIIALVGYRHRCIPKPTPVTRIEPVISSSGETKPKTSKKLAPKKDARKSSDG
jgi:hypothetical protein